MYLEDNLNHPFVKDIISRECPCIDVKVIAHSKSPLGEELITLQLKYHRFFHSEMLTHKRFSRNASSSRARPISKEIERIKENPAVPIYWGKNQSGMQAMEELQGEELQIAKDIWNLSIREAIAVATSFNKLGVHKQVTNRILEPYQIMETVFTGNKTAFEEFFLVRLHYQAQPEMIKLAYEMYKAINKSAPTETLFHLPYVEPNLFPLYITDTLMKISTARCARVSYRLFDGSQDVDKDIELADKLLLSKPPHASPAEHCAIAQDGKFANFNGWRNYRNILGV